MHPEIAKTLVEQRHEDLVRTTAETRRNRTPVRAGSAATCRAGTSAGPGRSYRRQK